MTKIKITVLKRFTASDVFGKNLPILPKSVPLGPCEIVCENVEYYSHNLELPIAEDPNDSSRKIAFCKWAHHDIYKDMQILLHGGDFSSELPGLKFTACSDGLKPVCFKLERID